jgi:hypothetical protein
MSPEGKKVPLAADRAFKQTKQRENQVGGTLVSDDLPGGERQADDTEFRGSLLDRMVICAIGDRPEVVHEARIVAFQMLGILQDIELTPLDPDFLLRVVEVAALGRHLAGTRRDDPIRQASDQLLELIQRFGDAALEDRFDKANTSYRAWKIGIIGKPASASSMRVFLSGVRAVLWARARKYPKERMTWEQMSQRLADGGTQSRQYEIILHGEQEFSKLIRLLSDIEKNREGSSKTDIEAVWLELQSTLLSIMGHLQPRDQSA